MFTVYVPTLEWLREGRFVFKTSTSGELGRGLLAVFNASPSFPVCPREAVGRLGDLFPLKV